MKNYDLEYTKNKVFRRLIIQYHRYRLTNYTPEGQETVHEILMDDFYRAWRFWYEHECGEEWQENYR